MVKGCREPPYPSVLTDATMEKLALTKFISQESHCEVDRRLLDSPPRLSIRPAPVTLMAPVDSRFFLLRFLKCLSCCTRWSTGRIRWTCPRSAHQSQEGAPAPRRGQCSTGLETPTWAKSCGKAATWSSGMDSRAVRLIDYKSKFYYI